VKEMLVLFDNLKKKSKNDNIPSEIYSQLYMENCNGVPRCHPTPHVCAEHLSHVDPKTMYSNGSFEIQWLWLISVICCNFQLGGKSAKREVKNA
jgi:hypothetical protein